MESSFSYSGQIFETLNKFCLLLIDTTDEQYWVESRYTNYESAWERVSGLIKTGVSYKFKIYNPEGKEVISF